MNGTENRHIKPGFESRTFRNTCKENIVGMYISVEEKYRTSRNYLIRIQSLDYKIFPLVINDCFFGLNLNTLNRPSFEVSLTFNFYYQKKIRSRKKWNLTSKKHIVSYVLKLFIFIIMLIFLYFFVLWGATFGGLLLALHLGIIFRWIQGPYVVLKIEEPELFTYKGSILAILWPHPN